MAGEELGRLILLYSMPIGTLRALMRSSGFNAKLQLHYVKALQIWPVPSISLGPIEMVRKNITLTTSVADVGIGHHEENQMAVLKWLKVTSKAYLSMHRKTLLSKQHRPNVAFDL